MFWILDDSSTEKFVRHFDHFSRFGESEEQQSPTKKKRQSIPYELLIQHAEERISKWQKEVEDLERLFEEFSKANMLLEELKWMKSEFYNSDLHQKEKVSFFSGIHIQAIFPFLQF